MDNLENEDMETLISLLKEFKNELSNSEDNRDVNRVMKLVNKTIEEKRYYPS